MRVLALDQATRTGFAIDHPRDGAIPLCGSVRLDRADIGTLLVAFEDWLAAALDEHRPDLLVFEAPFVPHAGSQLKTNDNTVRRLIGLASVAEKVGCRPIRERRLARVEKRNVVARCLALGYPVANHDAADAAGIWTWKWRHVPSRASGPS